MNTKTRFALALAVLFLSTIALGAWSLNAHHIPWPESSAVKSTGGIILTGKSLSVTNEYKQSCSKLNDCMWFLTGTVMTVANESCTQQQVDDGTCPKETAVFAGLWQGVIPGPDGNFSVIATGHTVDDVVIYTDADRLRYRHSAETPQYTVAKGDTLIALAKAESDLGHSVNWKALRAVNAESHIIYQDVIPAKDIDVFRTRKHTVAMIRPGDKLVGLARLAEQKENR